MSGIRTRGVCVTGTNVTNYTNTDMFSVKNPVRFSYFEYPFSRSEVYQSDHTVMDTPYLI